jgi:glycerophosphoryl diester phosphodiesterase
MMALPIRPPIIVHHKAALDGRTPPNSLEAIAACLDANAPFVEIDIMALADADYLLVHDFDLDAETDGSGSVSACSAEAAQALRIRHGGEVTPYHVPRLSEVVALFGQYANGTRLQLDFKNVLPFSDDEPLRRLERIIRPLGERVIVSSGADWQLRRLRKIAAWLELGFDIQFYIDLRDPNRSHDPRVPPYREGAYGYWDDHPLAVVPLYPAPEYLADRCTALASLVPGVTTFYVEHKLLAKSLDDGFNWAAALHELGIKLDVWTVDSTHPAAVANARRLLTAGADQFTTNTPGEMEKILSAAG